MELPNWRYENHKRKQKLESNELSFNTAVADRWDPLVRGPHASVTLNRAAALLGTARLRLVDGELRRR